MAASTLVEVTEAFTKFNNPEFKFVLFWIINSSDSVMVFEATLDPNPPPTMYVTVSVVFAGTSP